MNVLNTIAVVSDTANTITAISVAPWNKNTLGKLAITTSLFAGVVALTCYLDGKYSNQ